MTIEEIKPKYQPVLVAWKDIIQSSTGWESLDQRLADADEQNGIVHQVGFLIDDTEDHIIILDAYFQSDDTVGTTHKIPRKIIESITYLS